MATRVLAPLVTASTWEAAWQSMHDAAGRRMKTKDVPRLTNAEAVALVRVWRGATTGESSLWSQFAAIAYGFKPPKQNKLRTDDVRARAWFPLAATADLWSWSGGIAKELDARGDQPPPSLAPNLDTFTDPVFHGQVLDELRKDGHERASVNVPRQQVEKRQGFPPWLLLLGAWWFLKRGKR